MTTDEKVKQIFSTQQVKLLTPFILNRKSEIKYICPFCGEESTTTWSAINKRESKLIGCLSCLRNRVTESQKVSFSSIKRIFKENGVVLLSKTYDNYATPLFFKCKQCGSTHSITYNNIKAGTNRNFLCPSCIEQGRKYNEVLTLLSSEGITFEEFFIDDGVRKVRFKCKGCGSSSASTVGNLFRNPTFLCDSCREDERAQFIEDRKRFLDSLAKKNSSKILKNYKNVRTPIIYECKNCKNPHSILWSDLLRYKRDFDFLCSDCRKGNLLCPDSPYDYVSERSRIDFYWFSLVKDFFNIDNTSPYSSHHILPWKAYPDYRTSIFNGFPLPRAMHKSDYISPTTGIKDPFHKDPNYLSIKNFPEDARLPYHIYSDFRFLDLNKNFITEIIYHPKYSQKELYNKKLAFSDENILFIPIYLEELFIKEKREIIFSILKHKVGSMYPDIYKYTNTEFFKIPARKCTIKEIPYKIYKEFFNRNHIQGSVNSNVCLGLYYNDVLVQAMSFGKPRMNTKYEWELLRLASVLNTTVVGGAQKMLKFFISNYNPKSIISYCDIRFSSIAPEDTIYAKLGFKYIGYSEPNYRYLDPKTKRLHSRQKFQKHKLSKLLDNFDENLTEKQNMVNNGYEIVYDCGNHKFLWES